VGGLSKLPDDRDRSNEAASDRAWQRNERESFQGGQTFDVQCLANFGQWRLGEYLVEAGKIMLARPASWPPSFGTASMKGTPSPALCLPRKPRKQ
jgi:hypothetical protein